MKKLKKEDVYINLQGKSKDELTDLYNFLESVGEKQYDNKEGFINDNYYNILELDEDNEWTLTLESCWDLENKQEVTIQQLKNILQPMETLEQQLEKAKAEVKRIEQEIEEQNKPKIGDWLISNDNTTICIVTQKGLDYITDWKTDFYKCTDQELINKLNDLINAR